MDNIGRILKHAKSDIPLVHNGIRKLEKFVGEVDTDFLMHPSHSEDGSYTIEFIKPDRRFLFSVETDGNLTFAAIRTEPQPKIDHGFINNKEDAIRILDDMR